DPSPELPDNSFSEKKNSLFWRGATSEGVSVRGTWTGTLPERLVHHVNNLTDDASVQILLPASKNSFLHEKVQAPNLKKALTWISGLWIKVFALQRRDCDDQA